MLYLHAFGGLASNVPYLLSINESVVNHLNISINTQLFLSLFPYTLILTMMMFLKLPLIDIECLHYLCVLWQLKGWYSKDDVVAEWKEVKGDTYLDVHCYVSGPNLLLDLAAKFRYHIFSKELPLVSSTRQHRYLIYVEST